jgi:hypothetical protein
MTHQLVPISQDLHVLRVEKWRCVRCGRRWRHLDVHTTTEECPDD